MFIPAAGGSLGTEYGKTGSLWSSGRHTGVDIVAKKGATVYAAYSGVVISVGWGGAYGNLIKVRHDDGTIGYYAHLSAFSIEQGQRVTRGTPIGRVGSTGNSTGPHLHFEVRSNGKSINPMSYLSGDGGGKLPANSGGGSGVADTPTPEELALEAGFTAAFFNSNPELKKLFDKALREDWSGNRLAAAVQNSEWYKSRSAKQREMEILRQSDPAEYKARVDGYASLIKQAEQTLGVSFGRGTTYQKLMTQVIANGWGLEEIIRFAGQTFDFAKLARAGKLTSGKASELLTQFKEMASAYGVGISDRTIGKYIDGILSGNMTEEALANYIKDLAKQTYVGLADQIDAGLTVRQAAEPYIQTMSRLLELDPNSIDLTDPSLRQALSYRDKDGKIGTKTIYEFEQDIKNDSRWLKTKNAEESFMGVGRRVLADMGLVF